MSCQDVIRAGVKAIPVSGEKGADRPEDLSLWVRCITRGMPGAIFPTVYNANADRPGAGRGGCAWREARAA